MHTLLSCRTNFSLGESILTIDKLVMEAVDVGAKAVAVTDTMSVTSMIDFTNQAREAGLKPIIGCRLRLVDDITARKVVKEKFRQPEFFVTYYVLSEKGMLALFRLLSKANDDDHFYYSAKLSFDDLFATLADLSADDVAIASSDAHSLVLHSKARDMLEKIARLLGSSNTFLTLTPVSTAYYDAVNYKAAELGRELGLSMLVTRPCCYGKDEADAHEVLGAITNNNKVTDGWHKSPHQRDMHPMNDAAFANECINMGTRLKKRGLVHPGPIVRDGVANGKRLVSMAAYEWKKAPISLPQMAPDEFQAVVEACQAGWKTRFGEVTFGHKPTPADRAGAYKERLLYELSVLKTLNFSGYFLLVADVVNFAKSQGILVGPGRGSVGGSLVAYLMGITDCDPLRFGLLFERFINPDRIDLPDADLDFMSARRKEVVDYVTTKYGAARVAGVSNFSTLGPASAIRDVSRVMNLAETEYRCSKLAPKESGMSIELSKAAVEVAEIGEFRDKYEPIWDVCLKLEGVMRNVAQHAAGLVVGGVDLVERAVVERRKNANIVCWDKRIVEDQGLVKMDLLGLSTLDLINQTLLYIRKRHSKKVNLLRIDLDDAKVLDNFAQGLTTGVFQFESPGMRTLLRNLGKDGCITFDDISAATALYRPGPMKSGMMDQYWKRKQGVETVEYDHPLLEPVVADTYGVIVYQEQVMQAARVLAGYTAGEADNLRKIMGKKLPEKMAKEREKFVDGCVAVAKMDESEANSLFDKIAKFAEYGFNKSHSVEYTLISYQCMWLKTYYAVEFVAAALSKMDADRLPALLQDAHRLGIEIVLPDVNISTEEFEILTDAMLAIPFTNVKGLSEKAALEIVEKRKLGGKFKDKADFEKRCRSRMVHAGKIETLDKIGAFASIEPTQPMQRHPDRIKDQLELIPGLITDWVPIDRAMLKDAPSTKQIIEIVHDYFGAHGPTSEDDDRGLPVKPHAGKNRKVMVIFDCAHAQDEKMGQMARSDNFTWETTQRAFGAVGLRLQDLYVTALLKRPKDGKIITPHEIVTWTPYLMREIEVLKPPAIVLLGSTVVRQFLPDFKGRAADSAGKVVYNKDLDANLIVGFGPGECYFDPDKSGLLEEVFGIAYQLTM